MLGMERKRSHIIHQTQIWLVMYSCGSRLGFQLDSVLCIVSSPHLYGLSLIKWQTAQKNKIKKFHSFRYV